MNGEKSLRKIQGTCGACVNGKIYICCKDHNGLYEFDLKSKDVYMYKRNSHQKSNMSWLSQNSIVYKNSVYFAPSVENSLLKIDLIDKSIREIDIEAYGKNYSMIIWREELYLLPEFYSDYIPCINLETEHVRYIKQDFGKQIDHFSVFPLFGGCVLLNDCVYRICKFGPYIQQYDIKNNSVKYRQICGSFGEFRDIAYDGRYFWLITLDSCEVIQYDLISDKTICKINVKDYIPVSNLMLGAMKIVRDKVCIVQKNGSYFIQISFKEKDWQVHIFNCLDIKGFSPFGEYVFADNIISDLEGNIYLLPNLANGVVIINEDGKTSLFETEVSCEKICDALGDGINYNESMSTIQYFLDIVKRKETREIFHKGMTVGSVIWSNLKGDNR